MSAPVRNRRILLIDDHASIHDDISRILVPSRNAGALDAAADALFGSLGGETVPPDAEPFQLDSAFQGQEGCEKAARAVAAGEPYALAFVDMRMPPGWDGLTTILRLWEIDPELQVVLCTAYSDRTWSEIQATLTARDRWLVLKKPFDKVEILQLAQSLTEKWNLTRLARAKESTLQQMVDVRTEQLRRALAVKNDFLANISHELLTPLNGIVGMIDLLSTTTLDAEQSAFLDDARGCSERLQQLLQQVVAYNQAEAGTLLLSPVVFSPADLLEQTLAPFRARAELRQLALVGEADPSLPSDLIAPRAVIFEVLRALVDNAVKFTKQGRVTVRLRAAGEFLRCEIEDTGSGLDAAQLEWIAQPFAQVDGGLTRRGSGFGLGLPLARRLTQSLGGELTLTSAPNQGTTVVFTALLGRPATALATE